MRRSQDLVTALQGLLDESRWFAGRNTTFELIRQMGEALPFVNVVPLSNRKGADEPFAVQVGHGDKVAIIDISPHPEEFVFAESIIDQILLREQHPQLLEEQTLIFVEADPANGARNDYRQFMDAGSSISLQGVYRYICRNQDVTTQSTFGFPLDHAADKSSTSKAAQAVMDVVKWAEDKWGPIRFGGQGHGGLHSLGWYFLAAGPNAGAIGTAMEHLVAEGFQQRLSWGWPEGADVSRHEGCDATYALGELHRRPIRTGDPATGASFYSWISGRHPQIDFVIAEPEIFRLSVPLDEKRPDAFSVYKTQLSIAELCDAVRRCQETVDLLPKGDPRVQAALKASLRYGDFDYDDFEKRVETLPVGAAKQLLVQSPLYIARDCSMVATALHRYGFVTEARAVQKAAHTILVNTAEQSSTFRVDSFELLQSMVASQEAAIQIATGSEYWTGLQPGFIDREARTNRHQRPLVGDSLWV